MSDAPQYGQPQQPHQPAPQHYGPPQYGQPQYGQPQYGPPQHGQPRPPVQQFGQPQWSPPHDGQPQHPAAPGPSAGPAPAPAPTPAPAASISPFVPGGTVFRPSREVAARYWRINITFGALYVVLFGLLALLQWRSGLWSLYLVGMIVLAGLTVTLTALAVNRSRIEFRDGAYVIVQGLLPTKAFSVAEVQRVVTVGQMSVGAVGSLSHQMILGAERRWAWLTSLLWSREQLTALALDLQARGAELVPVPGPTTPAEMRRWDPRTQTWFEVNRILVAVLAGLAAIVLVVAIVVVVLVVAFSSVG
ncbi:proline-rich domain-containing protein [Schumannella soli]|uniref:proline-rich domain-containing protein n=1 Tax=Schumannella soli TaxID=2590779 RepID=UPI001C63E78B|nr:proline-rich domain-containing protein [Schumannella soli]